MGLFVYRASRQVRALSGVLPPAPASAPLPSLSVVVAARDEAAGIETTVTRLLAQRYPGLEVVVVDDRSTDGTGEILDRLAAGRGAAPSMVVGPGDGGRRLAVIHNRVLPADWLGKCHACHLGAARARGDWLLFTDGDVSLVQDDLLARVMDRAVRLGLDHVAVLPDLRPMPALQAALVSAFGQMFLLAARAFEMDRDRPRGGAGVGAFNLVRRAAYERIGGHRLLRMDLADDFKLGRLLKESGARQRIYLGLDRVRCAWHRGTARVILGLEKNLFGGFDFSMTQLLVWSAVVLLITFGPAAGGALALALAPAGTPLPWIAAGLPAALQAGLHLAAYATEGRRHGYAAFLPALLHPLSVLLLIAAAWNSALRTLAQGGVFWRETFYPLAALRLGIVRPGAGRGVIRA